METIWLKTYFTNYAKIHLCQNVFMITNTTHQWLSDAVVKRCSLSKEDVECGSQNAYLIQCYAHTSVGMALRVTDISWQAYQLCIHYQYTINVQFGAAHKRSLKSSLYEIWNKIGELVVKSAGLKLISLASSVNTFWKSRINMKQCYV